MLQLNNNQYAALAGKGNDEDDNTKIIGVENNIEIIGVQHDNKITGLDSDNKIM